MNREIKFRAWEKDEKAVGGGTMWDVRELDFTRGYAYVGLHEADLDHLPLMQFTGLKDRNEKEIFEGDVVGQCWHGAGEHHASHCMEFPWTVVADEKNGGWKLSRKICRGGTNCPDMLFQEMTDEKLEVIGNIYENPDLLATPPNLK